HPAHRRKGSAPMRRLTVKTRLLTFALLVATAPGASAQVPIRVRGAIATVPVRLADNSTVTGVVKAALRDIKEGAFVGTAARPKGDGTFVAQEVLIFP